MIVEDQRYKEHELDFTMYMDNPDTFKKQYPKKGECVTDTYYTDQAPSLMDLRGYNGPAISSFFTPFGISGLDGWAANEIRRDDSKYSPKELERLIRRNPHLHNIIKTNLLDNLKAKYPEEFKFKWKFKFKLW